MNLDEREFLELRSKGKKDSFEVSLLPPENYS